MVTGWTARPKPPPEPVPLRCELCGEVFCEDPFIHDPRLVPICFDCSFAGSKTIRLRGTHYNWTWEWERPAGTDRLIYQQIRQIETMIVTLEDECTPSPTRRRSTK
jgi:hypothetical protein